VKVEPFTVRGRIGMPVGRQFSRQLAQVRVAHVAVPRLVLLVRTILALLGAANSNR
jgi:hypothetical protein